MVLNMKWGLLSITKLLKWKDDVVANFIFETVNEAEIEIKVDV